MTMGASAVPHTVDRLLAARKPCSSSSSKCVCYSVLASLQDGSAADRAQPALLIDCMCQFAQWVSPLNPSSIRVHLACSLSMPLWVMGSPL